MSQRYFTDAPIRGSRVTLAGSEAHHLIHVMRSGPGDEVVLFDGSGAEFSARIERVGRAEVELAVLARREIDRELPWELTLGVALPKGDRQRWLAEKAVELGVRRLVPLAASRSVARPSESALARLRRTVVEASKQCGRNRLMEIAEPEGWSEFVAGAGTGRRLLAHPEGPALAGKLFRVPGVERSEPPGKETGGSLRLTASHSPRRNPRKRRS
jgi:16S rRNA (uracil1498-N3)-methyltransferase